MFKEFEKKLEKKLCGMRRGMNKQIVVYSSNAIALHATRTINY